MAKAELNGIEMYYEATGSGEPLVFIHGLGSSTIDWRHQVRHFSSQYRVLVYDVRGHGRTEKPPGPYSVKQFAMDLESLMQHLDLVPAHVVGISMGGFIGFQLAVDSPSALRSLVVVNSVPSLRPKSLTDRVLVWQRYFIVRFLGLRKLAKVLAPRLFPEPKQEPIRREFIDRWAANDKQAYLASMKALFGWSVEDRLSEIGIPTLFVTGDQDYTPVGLKEKYADQMPNARMAVIENSRHATPIDQPHEFNRVVTEFLKDLGNPHLSPGRSRPAEHAREPSR